jgi:spore coat polysaccharide biosynthesis protein SpsF
LISYIEHIPKLLIRNTMKEVLIGIQARSTSTRLPAKCYELIAGTPTIDRVIDVCKKSAAHMTNYSKIKCTTSVALLVPEGDEVGKGRADVLRIEGGEDDVLGRYAMAQEKYNPDFMVRITGDCPLHDPRIISKHISVCVGHGADYVLNCDERVRTYPDGHDVEVLSARLWKFLFEKVESPEDAEHVTSYLRDNTPDWALTEHVHMETDQSHLKISVDTDEDLSFVRTYHQVYNDKLNKTKNLYGRIVR